MDYTTKLSNNTNPSFKMTREEKIKEARHEWYLRTQDADFCAGFQKGAEWADEHPKLVAIPLEEIENIAKDVIDKDWQEQQDRLWRMIERNLRGQFIRKAVEWLEKHYQMTPNGGGYFLPKDCIEQFRKAMEGE